jgi:hypothetical protein
MCKATAVVKPVNVSEVNHIKTLLKLSDIKHNKHCFMFVRMSHRRTSRIALIDGDINFNSLTACDTVPDNASVHSKLVIGQLWRGVI